MYQQIDKATLAPLGQPGPLPLAIAGWSPPATYDLEWLDERFALRGTEFWPLVPTEPAYDPATQRLGALVAGNLDPATRTVPATYAVEALPPPPPPPSISTRQFFQQIAKDGDCTEAEALAYVQTGALPRVLADVIDTLPETIRFDVKMEVIGANEFIRTSPTVDLVGYLLGKDAAALDKIWRLAAAL